MKKQDNVISLKKTENKKWGISLNGDIVAQILLNKQNSIRLYRDLMAKLSAYELPIYDIEIKNIQDGLQCSVWRAKTDDLVFEKTIWFVDYDEVV